MNILQRFSRTLARSLDAVDRFTSRVDRIGRAAPKVVEAVQKDASGLPISSANTFTIANLPNLNKDKLTKPYAQHAWVYAAISKYADFIKALPLRLKQGPDTENAREIETGELYSVLNRPNELWSGSDLKEATIIWLLMKGNAVWLLDRQSYEQDPEEIWCLPHTFFEPVYIKGTWNVEYWKMHSLDGTRTTPVAPWNVVFMRLFSPYNLFWGQAALVAASKSLDQDWAAILFNQAFFEHGAVPGGIMTTTRDMGDAQLEQLDAWFRENYRGVHRAFETIITEEGVADYKQLALSHQDMHFEGLRHMNREEIAGVLKVPPSIMGWKDQTHKATQEKELRDWISGPVKGLCAVIEESLRSQLFFPYDGEQSWVEFDFSGVAALQEDYTERVNRANVQFSWGVPVSELSRLHDLGIEPYEGWDQSLLPISLVPNGMGLIPRGAASESESASYSTSFPTTTINGETTPSFSAPNDPPRTLSEPLPRIELREHTAAEVHLCREWISKTQPMEIAFNGQITKYLLRAQRWIGNNLISNTTPEDMLADILSEASPDWLKLPATFDKELTALSTRLYRKIGEEVGPTIEQRIQAAKLPYNFDINHYRLTNFMHTKSNKVVLHINDEFFRQKVTDAVADHLQRNTTVGELQDYLFGDMDKYGIPTPKRYGIMGPKALNNRARTIAVTETQQCANGLEFLSEQIAGVKEHQWVAALDEVTRSTHAANMARGPWTVGRMFPNGCRYPGDINGPVEEVINCRCSLIPVG